MIGLHSCSPSYRLRKEQKQDNKLYKEVISNDRVLPKAANVYNMLHPITQKIIYIKGEDSIRVDSIPYDVVRDSLIKVECPTINFDSLKKAWTKVIYHYSVDTVITPDTTCQHEMIALKIENVDLRVSNASKDGQILQQDKQIKATNKKSNIWMWLFIGMAILFAGAVYLIFRK